MICGDMGIYYSIPSGSLLVALVSLVSLVSYTTFHLPKFFFSFYKMGGLVCVSMDEQTDSHTHSAHLSIAEYHGPRIF
jgi:hypothetical protein